MKLRLLLPALILCATTNCIVGQTTDRLKAHIVFLSSDSLHGRYTGSSDEKIAASYIIREFQRAGVTNLRGNQKHKGYLQSFVYHPKIDSARVRVKGNNVIGFIDNKQANTIVIGAHYDHLGWGDSKHSAYRGEKAVHNGADDNASGVAAILEIAAKMKSSALKNYNYLFIAFSGEELGLFGSKWFVEHPKVNLGSVNYMLNFDMVGRIDSSTQTLIVNGVGTSPAWNTAMDKIKTPLHIKTTTSGVGPSDHTSFYLKDIPVLHFFSGQHKDYHKPSDDEFKINYKGLDDVVNYVTSLIANLNDQGKITFTKTKDDDHANAPKFTVTMGIMPDYTYEGEGMRIDGVTEGKPAAVAGLKQGDVVIQLGDTKVKDMMSYMQALSHLKKGDKAKVKFKRGGDVIEKEVQF